MRVGLGVQLGPGRPGEGRTRAQGRGKPLWSEGSLLDMGQHMCVLGQGRQAIPMARPSHWLRQQDLGTVLANPRILLPAPQATVCTSCPTLPCPAQPARVAESLEPMRSLCPSLLCLPELPSFTAAFCSLLYHALGRTRAS